MADQNEQQKKQEEERKKREEEMKRQQASASQRSGSSEAKTGRAASTYSGTQAKDDPRGDTFLPREKIKELADDIGPGELGLLKLSEEGEPQGQVIRGKEILQQRTKDADEFHATVMGNPKVALDELVTPSGAPVTRFMNPDPVLWDAGMLARNPPPPPPEGDVVIGGGVVNQPVRV
jgi:hypothetical protein